VGRNGDDFIDPENPFCSCESYFYNVLSGKAKYCYHILSYKIAEESGLINEVRLDDEEYDTFLKLLITDIMRDEMTRK
jgi:predicted nucleic acid-binding Zn finger protein